MTPRSAAIGFATLFDLAIARPDATLEEVRRFADTAARLTCHDLPEQKHECRAKYPPRSPT